MITYGPVDRRRLYRPPDEILLHVLLYVSSEADDFFDTITDSRPVKKKKFSA